MWTNIIDVSLQSVSSSSILITLLEEMALKMTEIFIRNSSYTFLSHWPSLRTVSCNCRFSASNRNFQAVFPVVVVPPAPVLSGWSTATLVLLLLFSLTLFFASLTRPARILPSFHDVTPAFSLYNIFKQKLNVPVHHWLPPAGLCRR